MDALATKATDVIAQSFIGLRNLVEDGTITWHDGLVLLKRIDGESKLVQEYIKLTAFDEYASMWKWELQSLPHDYEARMTERKAYDFKSDEVWNQLKEQIKEREQILKNATDTNVTVCDPDTWEVIPAVEKKTTVSYSLYPKK